MTPPTRRLRATALIAGSIALGNVHSALAGNSVGVQEATRPPAAPSTASKPPVATAIVEQPRATGYFVGDMVTQRVLLESGARAVSPASLPTPGRVSAWFERRTASIQTDSALRRWLVVEYQILNAPPKLVTVKLPAWSVSIKDVDQSPATLTIPAASINIAPLSPPGSPTQVGAADLRPDRLPPVIPSKPLWRSIELSAGALCVTLLAWLGWVIWRNRRALATQPFAGALREMRTLDEREPRAWQALHRAFDRTAGHVIQHSTLPVLFERAPQLLAARTEIEQFFAQSSLLFFGTPSVGATSPLPATSGAPGSPRALCVELRRIERHHER